MQTDVRQVFYFHADANSLGGFLGGAPDDSFRVVPTPCSVSLSPTGGSATAEAPEFVYRHTTGVATSTNEADEAKQTIGVRRAFTHVSARPLRTNGPWVQRVVSVVEGLHILGRLTAEKLIAQVFIEQPGAGGGQRKISFAGSKIDTLRLDGDPVEPVYNNAFLPLRHRDVDADSLDSPFAPELEWPALRGDAYRQGAYRMTSGDAPAWAVDRFGWMSRGQVDREKNGEAYALCSLVDRLDGVPHGQGFAHAIDLPGFGRIFLAEAVVLPHAVNLTMIRAELGCAVTGQVSAASVRSNGTTCPPN